MTALSDFEGRLYTPGDDGYDAARLTWLRNHDSHPALVAEPATVADVAKAVRYAAAQGLPVAIRASGHGAIKATDGAIVIKTDQLAQLTVDPQAKTAVFGPGVTMGDVVQAASAHGLAPITGDSPFVGATGFTIGGGQGWLSRQYGFGADSIISAQLVTGSGELLTVSETEHPDLLWGLKGGSGNFGIVVSLTIRLHPVVQGLGGAIYFDAMHAQPLLEQYRQWAHNLPASYTVFLQAISLPPISQIPEPIRGKRVIALQLFCNDDPDEAKASVQTFVNTIGVEPLADFTNAMRYVDLLATAPNIPPVSTIDASGLQAAITAEQVPELARSMQGDADFAPIIQIRPWGGALATAHPDSLLRYDTVAYSIYATLSVKAGTEEAIGTRFTELAAHIASYASGQAFINFSSDARAMQQAYSPSAQQRLRDLKLRYDPNNLFRLGHTLEA